MNRKLVFIILIVILIFVIAFVYSNSFSDNVKNETNRQFLASLGVSDGRKKILLMFAHPDDETMFFTPTLLALKEGGAEIHLLCLSSGNHYKLGAEREKEMKQLASSLEIPEDHVHVGTFIDKPGLTWSHLDVSNELEKYVNKWDIDSVITFDQKGASGHTNHISCYNALEYYKTSKRDRKVGLFVLNSGGKQTRYLGALGKGKVCGPRTAISNSVRKAWSLMKHHHSQNTWWRKLHIALSSHTYVNTLEEL